MTETTAVAVAGDRGALAVQQWTQDKIDLLKRTVAADTTNDEFALFGEVVRRTGLDPFTNQIYCIVRGKGDRRKVSFQTGIDGFRLIAERSGLYAGQAGPFWCGPDGKWVDVWLKPEHPAAARVGVKRKDFDEPVWAVATWDAYVQTKDEYVNGNRTGNKIVTEMWERMGALMLAKCAEALAIRKAFPRELSGLYSAEEMMQSEAAGDEAPQRSGGRAQAREAMRNVQVQPQRQGKPADQPPLPQWANDLRETLAGWDVKMQALRPLLGVETVTPGNLRAWGEERHAAGEDPYTVATEWVRAQMAAAEEQPAAEEAVDEGTGEIIEGQAVELPFDD